MRVQLADAGDRERIAAMFARCSPATLHQRFHAPVACPPARYLDWLLGASPRHVALVAREGEDVIGVAEAHRGKDGISEVALVVEDAWQRHGVGGELFRALLGSQRRLGARTIRATVLAEHGWLVRCLARLHRATAATAGTTCEIVIPLGRHERRRTATSHPTTEQRVATSASV